MSTNSAVDLEKNEVNLKLESVLDGAMTSMMMVDRDFNITYLNQSTVNLLAKHQDTLRTIFPGFDATNLLGKNIDLFHKNPSHQRQLLSNPAALPYQTDIDVGPLKFNLSVTAVIDSEGNYTGNFLEWSDVTALRLSEEKNSDYGGQIAAISKLQAVIEFNMDGTIISANDNFLNALDYRLSDIQGQHHSMFVDPEYKNSQEYRQFWEKLNRGDYDSAEYLRIGKGGKKVWIQASYNPIFDLSGKPFKVVKYATDITQQKNAEREIENLIEKASQGDLEKRIDVERYSGFLKELAEGINSLVDSVVSPIRENNRVVGALSEGDLREEMRGEFLGEYGVMQKSLNLTVTNLRTMVGDIQTSSISIGASAREIAEGNTDLSQRTEEQASSLQETASSMEELTSTVRQNADNARQANQLASGARDQAEKGGEVVQKAVVAMSEINSSSKKIADIIGVIDEIAFQTNLLALNAAVEAARAGEQGRGFAVVAGEVRNLAQRSAGAAKEIKTLIQDSVEKVEDGSRLVGQSGRTLEEIVGSVKKVSDIIAEIAAASQEQSAGIDQVNKAVTQMDEATQQNAALVEEAAAASESMDEQARGLQKLMAFFTIDETSGNVSVVEPEKRSAPPPVRSRAAPPAAVAQGGDADWEEF